MSRRRNTIGLFAAAALACSGGGSGGGDAPGNKGGSGDPGGEATRTCDGSCSQEALSASQVQTVVAQAVGQVQAAGFPAAVIAVVDRVGNVLAVFQMTGASTTTTITSQRGVQTGLEGFNVPSSLAAISKAGTAAYLSSQGNAFTTRTANQIIQQNFNPGVGNFPGGPLFGVQFSQLPCGDLVKAPLADNQGPKPMPLGFSADPGGLPLYINGVPVGGVGVELNGIYTIDPNISTPDPSPEEQVATAATNGFQAPEDRRADRISVAGFTLRFADDEDTVSASTPSFSSLPGSLIPVNLFYDGVLHAGTQFLTIASGIVSTTFQGQAAEILVKTDGSAQYPPKDSVTPTLVDGGLTAIEVQRILREGLGITARARAQIRRPVGSAARVTVSVVDLAGTILGIVRAPDAPIFGIDVSLQKARSVALFSQTTAAASFAAAPDLGTALGVPGVFGTRPFSQYVADLSSFTGGQLTLANGIAWGDRAIGDLSRPFFPDGINGNTNGPLSRPFNEWSPFSTGLQLEVSFVQLAKVLCLAAGNQVTTPFNGLTLTQILGPTCGLPAPPPFFPGTCTAPSLGTIANGLQIFAGSVPIYRGGTLIGGIGVSGDGIDQDDMVAFLGLYNAGQSLSGAINEAPLGIRTDTVSIGGNLRYVSCPVGPFNDSQEQDPCDGK
jgi:uncharacterized protein GlcG (DUF336 family)